MTKSRLAYATFLEVEFVLALAVSYFMGAQEWLLSIISLILTLLLGICTSLWYWRLIDKANKSRSETHIR